MWLIPIIGGVGVVGLLLMGALVLGVKKVAEENRIGPPSSEWVSYRDPGGGFTARFPFTPERKQQTISTPTGDRVIFRATCNNQHFNYEISYFDLGTMPGTNEPPPYYLEGAIAGLAKAAKGSVRASTSIFHNGIQGRYGAVEAEDYGAEALVLRIVDRVYIVLAESAHLGVKLQFDPFKSGFLLDDEWSAVSQLQLQCNVKNSLNVGEGCDARIEFVVTGGRAPFKWDCGTLPGGLRAEQTERRLVLSGRPDTAKQSEITVTVVDRERFRESTTFRLNVVTAPAKGCFLTPYVTPGFVGEELKAKCHWALNFAVSSFEWKLDERELPAGITTRTDGSFIHFEGKPAKPGKYRVNLGSEATVALFGDRVFKSNLEVVLSVGRKGSQLPPPQEILAASTLLMFDHGQFLEGANGGQLREHSFKIRDWVTDSLMKSATGEKVNMWALRNAKIPLLDPDKPVSKRNFSDLRQKFYGMLHDASHRVDNTNGLSLSLALAAVKDEELDAYDSVLLITSFRDEDVAAANLEATKKELLRFAARANTKFQILIARSDFDEELEAWLVKEHIKFWYLP